MDQIPYSFLPLSPTHPFISSSKCLIVIRISRIGITHNEPCNHRCNTDCCKNWYKENGVTSKESSKDLREGSCRIHGRCCDGVGVGENGGFGQHVHIHVQRGSGGGGQRFEVGALDAVAGADGCKSKRLDDGKRHYYQRKKSWHGFLFFC
jgi:hypothetical protein